MPLEPLYTQVLVLPLEELKSSILDLPDESKEPPTRGEVLAVGEGRLNKDGDVVPLKVQKGDVVVFRAYSAVKYTDHEVEVFFIEEGDLLAIDRPDAPAAE